MSAAHEPQSEGTDGPEGRAGRSNFIRDVVDADLAAGKYGGKIITRFPPEPNGYLHIGHAKAIWISYGIARDYGGTFNLRFDDTNPLKEETQFVHAIEKDIRWLGAEWGETKFASDYFEQMYAYAEFLIEQGSAYVDSSTKDEIAEYRGTISEPGRESPYRDRPVAENLDLFRRMRAGEFPDGAHVLRAKIDMASPNMLLRDPLLYRIRHAPHHRTGDAWCIYPMYDYAHCLEDAFEGVSHSLCSLEFETHRAVYDWVLDQQDWERRSRQFEFARLALSNTLMSKRRLGRLVDEGHVDGWDDPRMPTLAGLRRAGVTPEAIRDFADMIGVAKTNSMVDLAKFEFCLREDLNHRAPRVMCVLRPLKVVITNYPENGEETFDAPHWPHDVPNEGSRPLPFSREVWIERDDFLEEPPKKWFRLAPGREVRLRYAYVIKCDEVVKDDAGEVVELRCTYDPDTRHGAPQGRKVKGTLHWVSAAHAVRCEARLYDRLFLTERPGADPDVDFVEELNPDSLVRIENALIEPSVRDAAPGDRFQFERSGYFCCDLDSRPDALVFNRTVTLRDSWAKVARKPEPRAAKAQPKAAPATPHVPVRPTDAALAAAYDRFTDELGLPADDAARLAGDAALVAFFDAALTAHADAASVARWTVNELLGAAKDTPVADLPFSGAAFGALVALVDAGTISRAAGKDVLAAMLVSGEDPEVIVDNRGLRKVSDADALGTAIDDVLAAHPDELARYRGGKTGLLGFFTGQVMKATRGAGDPKRVRELLEARLSE